MAAAQILVADDDPITVKNLRRLLEKQGHRVTTAPSGERACKLLETQCFDLVLTDLVMESVDGIEVLARARALAPDTPVIIMTGFGSVQTAVEAMKRGAFHYCQKPFHPDEVRHLVDIALTKRQLEAQVEDLTRQLGAPLHKLLGNSPQIRAIRSKIKQLGESDVAVMITGASGTGKELVASAIHKASRRASKKFLPINCASLTDELVANELFGHEKDAFTGATGMRPGLLEAANGGTVFLDEVGDMPMPMQVKLLRVVQEMELIRVGGSRPIPIDVRIISATNRDLHQALQSGSFREDLFYRLNVIPVHMPPLAERREDIPLLARHFLDCFNQRSSKKVLGFSREVMDLLRSYDFPGNVRELENLVEAGAAMCQAEVIEVDDLPTYIADFKIVSMHPDPARAKTLHEVEMEYIETVLRRCGNNKSKAARVLGINRVSLLRKLKRRQLKE